GENAADLCSQLFIDPNLAFQQRRYQLRDRLRKRPPGDQGLAADQHQVRADIERRRLAGQPQRIVKCGAIGHERRGGQDAVPVCLYDSLIHVRREPEIVGVHYELLAPHQNRASRRVRNFLGLPRTSLASPWNSRVAPVSASYSCGFTTSWPMVPWPELILSIVPFSLVTSSSRCLCKDSSLSNLPAEPFPALRSAITPLTSLRVACTSSNSAGSLRSLPAEPRPAWRSASMASMRFKGARISWY